MAEGGDAGGRAGADFEAAVVVDVLVNEVEVGDVEAAETVRGPVTEAGNDASAKEVAGTEARAHVVNEAADGAGFVGKSVVEEVEDHEVVSEPVRLEPGYYVAEHVDVVAAVHEVGLVVGGEVDSVVEVGPAAAAEFEVEALPGAGVGRAGVEVGVGVGAGIAAGVGRRPGVGEVAVIAE